MDKDKRELAWKKWKPEFDVSANQGAAKCGFYAGYDAAAGHAAGQQQWVDVAVDAEFDGPYLCQLEVPQECGNIWTVFAVRQNKFNEWMLNDGETLIAYQPPPQPYQRPSAVEGDKNDER